MKNSKELKPCPFCGGEAALFEQNCDRPWHVLCYCGGRVGWFETKQEAIEAWNRRVANDT